MSAETPTVYVVDDDASLRKALGRALKTVGLNVKAFGSAQEFLDQGPLDGPGCLVVDVQMPGRSGPELQAELNARGIRTPIIFLTGHGDISMTVKAFKDGAVDFLTKPFKAATLLGAIREAIQKDERFRASRSEKAEIHRRLETLTVRERQVLDLVVNGLSNKQIAAELGAAERTVKVHRSRVLEKMQVTSVAELVRLVERVKAPDAPN